MKIINYTSYSLSDKLETLADILKIPQGTTLYVKQTPAVITQGDTSFLGIVQPLDYYPNGYELYLSPGLSTSEINSVLSHECVHLAQYATGRLRIDGTAATFDGKSYDYVGYDPFSPWESEAFKMQGKLLKLIKK